MEEVQNGAICLLSEQSGDVRVQVGLLVFSFFAKVTGHLILSVL